jgi:hypothetical protein
MARSGLRRLEACSQRCFLASGALNTLLVLNITAAPSELCCTRQHLPHIQPNLLHRQIQNRKVEFGKCSNARQQTLSELFKQSHHTAPWSGCPSCHIAVSAWKYQCGSRARSPSPAPDHTNLEPYNFWLLEADRISIRQTRPHREESCCAAAVVLRSIRATATTAARRELLVPLELQGLGGLDAASITRGGNASEADDDEAAAATSPPTLPGTGCASGAGAGARRPPRPRR